MVTRREKREQEKEKNYSFEFIKIQKHFFKEFIGKLKKSKTIDLKAISHMAQKLYYLQYY